LAVGAWNGRSFSHCDEEAVTEAGSTLVRPYRTDDERGLVELFRLVYGRELSELHWKWKLQRPAGPVDNVWLAVSDTRPVFQYGGIPTRFRMEQKSVDAMVAVDAMTAPAFRRRGLLTEVVSRAHAVWREAGVSFVIGLPNQQWGSRTGALGWRPLFQLQWLVRPLRPEAILARRLRLPILRHAALPARFWNRFLQRRLRRDAQVRTRAVDNADDSFDRLWERCKSDWTFCAVRDRSWVNWRFLASPVRPYEVTQAFRGSDLVGYTAHCLSGEPTRRVAHLAEIFAGATDDAARDALLFDLIEKLLPLQAQSLTTLAVPGTPLYRWLRRAGFLAGPGFSVQLVPLQADLPFERMLEPGRWNLSGADFDVI
jgi:hypothetical protein